MPLFLFATKVTNIPVHALLTLIQKVVLIDGSLHKSLFQSNTPFYQEFICSEIPTLHSTCLDLLASTIKGMRSSLIPHAGIVVMVISEYFNRTKLPAIRRKLYTVVRLLLSSMGVGMVMQLLQVVISNVFYDLNDNSGRSLLSACIDPVKTIILSPSKSSSNVEQRHQVQSSTVTSSESICNSQIMSPLCAKIGALETLEVLLNVGGSFRAYSWRAEMDLLLVNVARNAFYKAGMYEQRQPWTEEPSTSVFQLASLKALLASFLSSPHERHPYLEQGLELFNRGMLETGTELGNFCAHALLNLDVLIHPRQFAPQRVAHSDIGLRSGGLEQSVLGSDISQPPCSGHKGRTTDDLGVSIAEEPSAKRIAVEKNAPAEGGQAGPVPGSSWIDINMEDDSWCNLAGFDALCDLPDSFSVYPAPINITTPDSRNPGDEIPNKKSACQGGILSSDACSSQNVPALTSPILAATSVSGPEWDPLDSLFNVGGADADIPTWLESPESD
ncbi:hypothetical protein EJB05_42465 [Eragrostis curvula]|uniref:Pre-rRNA-processing protein RIX1 N-terminal domain-containing protein n=1 Tax=Eragrostis curvula TaxID=38414 RepID=A0A5J9TCB1_9POAL|nr:hypothetical protein EJB05_42465 [Eragrostis curvula]